MQAGALYWGKPGKRTYERLREITQELYPGSRVAAYWSAQDCIIADKVSFIGLYTAKRSDWCVAAGFQKWSMSFVMVSAILIRDAGCGVENPYA